MLNNRVICRETATRSAIRSNTQRNSSSSSLRVLILIVSIADCILHQVLSRLLDFVPGADFVRYGGN